MIKFKEETNFRPFTLTIEVDTKEQYSDLLARLGVEASHVNGNAAYGKACDHANLETYQELRSIDECLEFRNEDGEDYRTLAKKNGITNTKLVDFLKEKKVLDVYIANLDSYFINYDPNNILKAFDWSNTIEGDDFWLDLCEEYWETKNA